MTNELITSEYFQRQIIDMIELSKSAGTNAVEFVQAQAPDLVRQIIAWEVAESALISLLCVLVIFFMVWITKRAVKTDHEALPFIAVLLDGMGGVVTLLCLMMNLSRLVKVLVAPKVFLIEYVASLFKK